jgi:hypothetical protein
VLGERIYGDARLLACFEILEALLAGSAKTTMHYETQELYTSEHGHVESIRMVKVVVVRESQLQVIWSVRFVETILNKEKVERNLRILSHS